MPRHSQLLLLWSFLLRASAFTWYVSPFGKDSNNGTSPDQAFQHIPVAVAAAHDLDTILLMNGVYGYADAFAIAKSLTLKPYSRARSSKVFFSCQNIAMSTFIQIEFTQKYGKAVIVADISIQYCTTAMNFTGGMNALGLPNVTVSGVSFIDNGVAFGMSLVGGPSCMGGSGAIGFVGCTFAGSTGPAITVTSTWKDWCLRPTFTVQSSVFRDNAYGILMGTPAKGAANMAMTLNECDFSGNKYSALRLSQAPDSAGTNSITNCNFTKNGGSSGSANTAVFLSEIDADFNNCFFNSNQGRFGAALYLGAHCNVAISDCYFNSNDASVSGGAISVSSSQLSIQDSLFLSNNATSDGGAIRVVLASLVNMQRVTVRRNAAQRGGAFFCEDMSNSSLQCLNCQLTKNVSRGGGMVNNCPAPS